MPLHVRRRLVAGGGGRETLHPHWNAQTRIGDPKHAAISTDPHTPVAGFSGGENNTLDIVKQ